MPEIGPTLREARIRRKIDIGVVEEHTKIRAKYLRALENEEFGLLPGPTYVRTFLRTYAEFLGLDAQLLIDEYRSHHADAEEPELFHYTEPPLRERLGGQRQGPLIGRGALIGLALVGVLGFLGVLGLTGGAEREQPAPEAPAQPPPEAPAQPPPTAVAPAETLPKPRPEPAAAAPRSRVRVQFSAAGSVWICLVDDRGRRRIDARTLAAGSSRGPFTARRFRVTLGNGQVAMRVNGRVVDVPETATGAGYEITPKAIRRLGPGRRPTCS